MWNFIFIWQLKKKTKTTMEFSIQKALKSAQKMVRNTKIRGVYCYRDPSFWAGYVLLDAFN